LGHTAWPKVFVFCEFEIKSESQWGQTTAFRNRKKVSLPHHFDIMSSTNREPAKICKNKWESPAGREIPARMGGFGSSGSDLAH